MGFYGTGVCTYSGFLTLMKNMAYFMPKIIWDAKVKMLGHRRLIRDTYYFCVRSALGFFALLHEITRGPWMPLENLY